MLLCFGSTMIALNFAPDYYMDDMLKPEFLTPERWVAGLVSLISIGSGIAIYSWLWKDIFSWYKSSKSNNINPYRKSIRTDGVIILFVIGIIVIAILYYAIR
jgi:hypothetical protein